MVTFWIPMLSSAVPVQDWRARCHTHLLSRYLASSETTIPVGPRDKTSESAMEKVSKNVAGRNESPKSSYMTLETRPVSG